MVGYWPVGQLGKSQHCIPISLDKGQEFDWFGNSLITAAAVITVTGFVAFLVREFRHEKSLVNLRALSNRNLAIGCALVFALGGVLYGLTTVLPIFYQTLLNYDATSSGLAVSPRGLGSIASSVAVGVLVWKLDPRKIVAAGFADVLRYFALTCALCIPFAFLLKKPKADAQGGA